MYRTLTLTNGKIYQVPVAVADSYERLSNKMVLNMEHEEEDKDKKKAKDMEHEEDKDKKKAKDMEHEEEDKDKKKAKDMEEEEDKDKKKETKKDRAGPTNIDFENLDHLKDLIKGMDADDQGFYLTRIEEIKRYNDWKSLEALIKDAISLRGRVGLDSVDRLRAENTAMRSKFKRLDYERNNKEKIKNKLKVLNHAQRILKVDSDDLLDLTDLDLKTNIIKKVFPEAKTDGQSGHYINALYDLAVKDETQRKTRRLDDMVGELETDLITNRSKKNMGRMKQIDMEAKKAFTKRQNAWKKNQYSKSKSNY